MSYIDFLAAKQRRAQAVGIDADRTDIHASLHDWQADGVLWALKRGRCALFWDTGLGKTRAQLEWARLIAERALILAPLSVARQTVREALKLDMDVRYVRSQADVHGPGVFITNYEMAEHFDAHQFGAVVLDESSILKNVDGRTRQRLTDQFRDVPYRLACSATPAPNDVSELTNHAEFLGVMSRAEMLSAYFVNDEKDWRLKGHAAIPMFRWMSTWAQAIRRPSDVGGDDSGYDLPALHIIGQQVEAPVQQDGQLFATDLGGVGGRARVRKLTTEARCARAVELCQAEPGEQWIVWCGLNDEAARIAAAIPDAVNVEGSWAPDDKADALERFQDGAIRVLVSKPSIAGTGMNFQNCARMAFVGLSDSWEQYYQSIRRCWRFGQTREVRAYLIVSELEQAIVANVKAKEVEAMAMTAALVKHMSQSRQEVYAA